MWSFGSEPTGPTYTSEERRLLPVDELDDPCECPADEGESGSESHAEGSTSDGDDVEHVRYVLLAYVSFGGTCVMLLGGIG